MEAPQTNSNLWVTTSESIDRAGRSRSWSAGSGFDFLAADLGIVGVRSLFGVMCTYRRPDAVATALDAIGRQTLPLDLLVVVDNDDDAAIHELVEGQTAVNATYVGVRPNGGPAGAFNSGLFELPDHRADDLVVFFDDDDPPVAESSIERLVDRLDDLTARGAVVSGVGLHGGLLDIEHGRVRPPVGNRGVVPVDHLHGGYLPVYRRSALHEVGGFDPQLFWGFEELDLGCRLTAAGHGLMVDMDHWHDVAEHYPKASRRHGVQLAVDVPAPGRYYSLRNLLWVLGRQHAWRAIVEVVVVRAIGKPLAGMLVRPRSATASLATNMLAVTDAARGRLGRRDHFPAVCGFATAGSIPGRVA